MWPGREPEHSGGERFFFSYDILWRMGPLAEAGGGCAGDMEAGICQPRVQDFIKSVPGKNWLLNSALLYSCQCGREPRDPGSILGVGLFVVENVISAH